MKKVSQEKFWKVINKEDVTLELTDKIFPYLNGDPCTTMFKRPNGTVAGKTVDYTEKNNGRIVSRTDYFLC